MKRSALAGLFMTAAMLASPAFAAGDKGFTTPELNAHSLRSLKDAVQFCSEGISTSRTCEIGLSQHGGIDYHGLVYLVDRVTQARAH